MSTANTVVDQFITNNNGVSMPHMKIQSNNLWFNTIVYEYPDELKMFIQIMKDACLAHALCASFSIPMN